MEMHHREDYQLIVAFIVVIHDAVRKPTNQTPTNLVFYKRPHPGMGGGSLYCRVYFHRKLIPEGLFSLLVIINREPKLGLGFGVEGVAHDEKRFQISSKTSCPDMGFTEPALISSSLRFATSAHFSSICDSVGFRVFSTESATRARSSTGRDSISRSKSSVFMTHFRKE